MSTRLKEDSNALLRKARINGMSNRQNIDSDNCLAGLITGVCAVARYRRKFWMIRKTDTRM